MLNVTLAEEPGGRGSGIVRTADAGVERNPPSSTTATYRLDIQGLRGLAVLLVVLFHSTGLVRGGYIGVDVFFVISGFVIAGLLRSQYLTPQGKRLRTFYARRARRLLPMLALTCSVTAVLGVALLSPLGASANTSKTAIAAALLNANTFLSRQSSDYFAMAPDANALLHTWSLSVEEQFYLLFPAVLVLAVAWNRRVRRSDGRMADSGSSPLVLVVVAVMAALSFLMYAFTLSDAGQRLIDLPFTSPAALAFYSAPTRAWEFLVGVMLSLLAPRLVEVASRFSTAASVTGLALVVGSALLFTESSGRSALMMLLPVVGASLLLLGDVGGSNPISSALSLPGAVWLGDLSYGWYLFHWPLIVFVAANTSVPGARLAAALVALGLAVVAKRFLEDRFRHDVTIRGARAAFLACVCVIVPVLVGVGSLAVDRVLTVDDLAESSARHADSDRGCNRRESPWIPLDSPECTWSVDQPRGTIVLLGDSHASMWTEAVVGAGNELGYDVVVATMSGCPMISGTVRERDGRPDVDCSRFVDEMVQEAVEMRPSVVMLAAGTTGVLSEREPQRWKDSDGVWVTGLDDVAAVWRSGLTETVERLQAGGVPTMIVNDIPYHDVSNETCGRLRFMVAPTSCASTISRADYESDRKIGRVIEDQVADTRKAMVMDPVTWLCDESSCSTFGLGTWRYRDGDHLSVAGSSSLSTSVEEFLRAKGL